MRPCKIQNRKGDGAYEESEKQKYEGIFPEWKKL